MAISFQETPNAWTTSGNPIRYVFTSDKTAQPNFTYQVRIEINSVEVEVHKIFVTQGTYGYFDLSDIAERYCNILSPNSALITDGNNYASIKITVHENYGTPPVNVLSVTSTQYYYKGKLSKRDWLQFIPSNYVFASNKLWLTNYPTSLKRYVDLSVDNPFCYIGNGEDLFLTVELYDSGWSFIATQSASATSYPFSVYNINRSNLLAMGFTSANLADTSYIEIQLNNADPIYSETKRMYIDDRCTRGVVSYLMFMTTIGELFTYKFLNNTKTNGYISSVDMETNFGQLDEDGTFAYDLGGLQTKAKIYTEEKEVTTDWLTETEQQWLVKELSVSPLVFYWDGSNWIRCRVSRSSYEMKQDNFDMNFRETFKIETDKDTSTVV